MVGTGAVSRAESGRYVTTTHPHLRVVPRLMLGEDLYLCSSATGSDFGGAAILKACYIFSMWPLIVQLHVRNFLVILAAHFSYTIM